MQIISLSGLSKSGKTTAANILCEIDGRFKRVSFADDLKDIYCKEMGINRSILDDVIEKEKHRNGMQQMGDFERAKDKFVFVNRLINRLDPSGYYVTDDTRYVEELSKLLNIKAVCCGVYAEQQQRKDRGWIPNPLTDNHPSELELGSISAYTWHSLGGVMLYNTKTKDHLRDQILQLVKKKFPFTFDDLPKLGRLA